MDFQSNAGFYFPLKASPILETGTQRYLKFRFGTYTIRYRCNLCVKDARILLFRGVNQKVSQQLVEVFNLTLGKDEHRLQISAAFCGILFEKNAM